MSTKKTASKKVAAEQSSMNEERIPLRITDTTLRDAHQSLWATRMRTRDIIDIIETIDDAGFYSLEVWGGATFDVCLRFLRENPWERLRMVKARAKKTPLQMLLRGQNVLGYKNYPDDVLDRFVALACANGVDIFRIFDALNDTRNLESAIKAVKKHGGHAQGTICYTISPVHTVQEFVRIAKEQVQIGIDSLCIKDMAGILSPISAEKLVTALIANVDVPIQLHCHATSGMATATYVEGVRAGAGAIDCAISVMAGSSSQPPVETMLSIFDETTYHANVDRNCLRKICHHFTELAPKRQLASQPLNSIDPEILIHHIPGGMISNLRSQLQQQDALDRIDDVLAEVPRVREDLGFPPLVTPTSQIVGVQSVLNVISGERYSLVTQETKEYVRGWYGRSPHPIDRAIQKKILGEDEPITCRPADLLKPMLPSATLDVDPKYIKNEEDIISYCLFPEPAMEYFKWRDLPTEDRPSAPADLERRREDAAGSKPAVAVPAARPFLSTDDYKEIQELMDKVHGLGLTEVTIRRDDLALSLKASGVETAVIPAGAPAPATQVARPQKNTAASSGGSKAAAPAPVAVPEGPSIKAPVTGTFYTSSGPGKPPFVKEGDTVKAGDTVCMVEAMKLFNQIKAPSNCKVLKLLVEHGANVKKDQPLMAIEPA